MVLLSSGELAAYDASSTKVWSSNSVVSVSGSAALLLGDDGTLKIFDTTTGNTVYTTTKTPSNWTCGKQKLFEADKFILFY